MLIKEAENKYGKELAMRIWEEFNLDNIKVNNTPDGLDIADFEWESIYSRLNIIPKDL